MTITATKNMGGTGGTMTCPRPTGLVNGDVVLLCAYKQSGGTLNTAGTTTGFTKVYTAVAVGTRGHVLWGKRITDAASEPADYTVTCTETGARWGLMAVRVTDLDASWLDAAPSSDYYSGAAPATINIPSASAVSAATTAMVFTFGNNSGLSYATWSAPGYTLVDKLDINNGTAASTMAVLTKDLNAAGASGAAAATHTPISASAGGFQLTLTRTVTPPTPTALDNWLAQVGPKYVAHRDGFYAVHGEFTIPGFQALLAWNPNVAWNIDVYKTSDDVWVASHDSTTGRVLSGPNLTIGSSTWADISGKTTLVGGNPVCRLDDLVAIAPPGTIFFIDNKQNSWHTQLFAKYAALGLGPGNVVNKNFIGSTATINAMRAAGYKTWAYAFDGDVAGMAANAALVDWIGFDYNGSQANWNTVIGFGKPSLAHILPSLAAKATADSKAATAGGTNFGYMVSNVGAVVPPAGGKRLFESVTGFTTLTEPITYNLATEFYVTKKAWVTKLWLYVPDNTGTLAPRGLSLWRVDSASAGTQVVPRTNVTPDGFNKWVSLDLAIPYELIPNQRYRVDARVAHNPPDPYMGYVAKSFFFNGSTDVINGYLVAPAAINATGSDQGSFKEAVDEFPSEVFNATFYGIDVTVTDVDPEVSTPVGAAALAHTWSVGAVGRKTMRGSAPLGHSWTISVQGVTPAVPPALGSAQLTHGWSVTAIGKTPTLGAATGGAQLLHSWEITAGGVSPRQGAAALGYVFEVTARGVVTKRGVASLGHNWTVSVQGVTPPEPPKVGGAQFQHSWNISVTGVTPEVAMNYGAAAFKYLFKATAKGTSGQGLRSSSAIHMEISTYARDHIRQRATDLMNCRVRITRAGTSYDPVTRRDVNTDGQLLYEGPARVWEVPAGQNIIIGDDEVTVTSTYMSLPFWVFPLPEDDDLIVVTESDDPDLTGRSLNVESTVRGGGLRASRRFQVTVSTSKKSTW